MSPAILHVADFAAPYPGAFIAQLRMLDDEVRRRGIAQCAFAFPTAAESTTWYRQLQADGSYTTTVDTPATRAPFSAARHLVDIAETVDASLIHTHFGTYDLPALLAAERVRRRGQPCRVIWHYRTALEQDVHRRSLGRRCKDIVRYRLPRRWVDGCVAVTHALAHEASRRGMGHKACAVTAGCDTETFYPDPLSRDRVRARLGLTPDDIVVLHLGWAWRRKGGDLLTAAAQRLDHSGHTRLVFLSVGATETLPPVRSLAVTDEIADLHRVADIFVSASRSEGFGNGVIEAMASGSVVVATLASGQREVFDGVPGCVSVPVDDAEALADGIAGLLARRAEWPRLGALNREHVVAHYDMRGWARRMADLYDKQLDVRAVQP